MSIRVKIVALVLASLLFMSGVFFVYSFFANSLIQEMYIRSVRSYLLYESETVNKTIARLEQNALDLAADGYTYILDSSEDPERYFGNQMVIDNFESLPDAVGGGVWYEPFKCDPKATRVCFYACRDDKGNVTKQDGYDSDEYNYHQQCWYREIKKQLEQQREEARKAGKDGAFSVAWSEVYYEKIGSKSCMATVGAGIYHDGEFMGMSTVDWQLQDVFEQLSKLPVLKPGFVLLIDPRYDSILMDTRDYNPKEEDESKHQFKDVKSLPWFSEIELPTHRKVKYSGFTLNDSVTHNKLTLDGTQMHSFGRLLDNGMMLLIQVPAYELTKDLSAHTRRASIINVLLVLFVLAFSVFFLTTNINRPLSHLMRDLELLGEGNLDVTLDVQRNDEIGTLGRTFNQMTASLKQYIAQKEQEDAARQRIANELEFASMIQLSALPSTFPPFPDRTDFDVYATMKPAKEVGGDFYDFFLVDDDHLVLVIADASGKGVPAAMFTMTAKTLIKTIAFGKFEPAELLGHVNYQLSENNDTGMFVTAFVGIVELSTGRFVFSNAGHLPPLWKKRGASTYEWLDMEAATSYMLGVFGDLVYTQAEVTLSPGDELFFYTDGVTEATSVDKQLFGAERLEEAMNSLADDSIGLPAKLDGVWQKIQQFCKGASQSDDTTMLIFTYKKEC